MKQDGKKVYVKKLFTPKRNSPVPTDGFKIVKTTQGAYDNGVVEMKSPSINTQKVNAKKRKVFRDTKGRTFVKQDGKKVYVKKLFTPK